MCEYDVQLVVDGQASLGEGPCWDSEKGLLYWVDIHEKCIHIHNPLQGTNHKIPVGKLVGSMAIREAGGIILAADQGFYTLDIESGEMNLIQVPSQEVSTNRFNDGKCDPAGRFWAGSMPMSGQEASGHLYCLDMNHVLEHKRDGIRCSNGMAWNLDCTKMYYIDSPTKVVVAFDYDRNTGDISNPSPVIRLPEGEGVPDGMTSDTEGMLWIAQWGGYKVSRWNPETGEKLEEIAVPAAHVTSCAFGGPEMNELYITTARTGLSDDMLLQQPHAGGLFRLKTRVKGQESFKFKG